MGWKEFYGCFSGMRSLLQSGFSDGVGGKSSRVARQFANFRWIALALWALWAFSAPCLALGVPTSSVSQLLTTPLWLDQGGAVVDLDGDGRPDLAIVRAEGRRSNAFQYRIELTLTTRVGPSSFSFSSKDDGVRIIPRDVDGDGDMDLVITSAWSFAPVGVWINDGHGGFTQGDLTAYPQSIWNEGPGIFSDSPRERLQAAVPESCRSWLVSPQGFHFCTKLLFERLPLRMAAVDPLGGLVNQPQTRAPPRFLLQQPC